MTIDDIKKLIASDESRTLELKKTTGELIKGMQTLCAFLNTDGGWLLFGVTPKLEILGQNVTDNTQREIAHEMTKIEPAISLPIEIIDVPERPSFCVIAIHCEPTRFGEAPYTYDGRAYYKLESTTAQMPRSMFEERLRRSNPSRFAWESQTNSNLHLEDLDESRIKGAVMYGIERGRMPASSATENTWTLLDKVASVIFNHPSNKISQSEGVSEGDKVEGGVAEVEGITDATKKELINILRLFNNEEGLKLKDIALKINRPAKTVERYLKMLKDLSVIEFVGSPRNGKYVLKKVGG